MLAISPKYKSLPYCSSEILFKFVNLKYNAACFLDSSSIHKDYGRYSFIAFNPFMFFESNAKDVIIYDNNKKIIDKKNGSPFDILNAYLSKFKIKKIDGLPPFQGGACGYFGYEMLEHIEDIDVPYNHMVRKPLCAPSTIAMITKASPGKFSWTKVPLLFFP